MPVRKQEHILIRCVTTYVELTRSRLSGLHHMLWHDEQNLQSDGNLRMFIKSSKRAFHFSGSPMPVG